MKIWTIEKKVAVETVNTDIAGSKNLRAPETYWFIGKNSWNNSVNILLPKL